MSRAYSLARSVAGLIRHPSRLPEWRRYLSRAWNGPRPKPKTRAHLVRTDGPPPRPVRVVIDADEQFATLLAPEWEQVAFDGGDLPSGTGLAVVGWPSAASERAHALLDAAKSASVPSVIIDSAPAGTPTAPHETVSVVVVQTSHRVTDYDGHPKVEVLPIAVQPRHHNPIQGRGRRSPVAYVTSGDGEVDPSSALPVLAPLLGGKVREGRAYHTVVALDADRETSRSALQQAAAGAVVVALDRALRETLPSCQTADSEATAEMVLRSLRNHDELRSRTSAPLVRHVLQNASATVVADRLLSELGISKPRRARPVSAIVPTKRPQQLRHVFEFMARQGHPAVQLILVCHGFEVDPATQAYAHELGLDDVRYLAGDPSHTLGALMNQGVDAADGEFVAKMDDDNFYGAHYLSDLLATFDFTGAEVAGKWAHFTYLRASNATFLRFPGAENSYSQLVQGGTLVIPRQVAAEVRFEDLPRRVDTTFLDKVAARGGRVYSADRYNFVSVREADVSDHTWKISDSELLAKPSRQLFFGEPWIHADV